ncbi:uncharacterized protein PV07_12877 [Cladophialophora immunda]|uniref:DUF659 domain-containing protein n=1 Tax=Cladophialophora immunda TaxID=569365 RepID=A0A0D2BTE3_9EURO|nr:uncharacterized protein PV07_12877 [Cladophialophora immunda]KIW21690.1 hypothetical protein PV07_12877 [Cladophialophora immunda]
MRDIWARLKEVDQLRHILTIPCDSHSLNLLVKDLCLKVPEFSEAIKDGNSVTSHFKRASKQLAGLREIQVQRDGKTSPLALAAETRWGSQYNLVAALLNNRSNLLEFGSQWDRELLRSETSRYVRSVLYNNDFWVTISQLERLLKPINMAITESQSERSHLGQVKERWLNLRQQLGAIQRSSEGLNWTLIWQLFEERQRTQLCEIHDLAFRLMPQNANLPWDRHEKAACVTELLNIQHETKAFTPV